jgi:dTDP-4-amino-4,6-dideoxygalactose transaminase
MIPITRPLVGQEEADAAAKVVLSGWLSQGAEVAAFEAAFAEFVGAKHACAVSNCTAALHLALLVAGVSPGDEVITVSSSFIASANVIRACGALPVFVDIRSDDYNIDPILVEAAFTARTKALLCVHQMGMPCDLSKLVPLARERGVVLIEDAACATGSKLQDGGDWNHVGAPHGDIACFSFHPRKVVTTGEGGMITTSHEDWDRKLRLLRQHGMSVPDLARHRSNQVIFEEYLIPGFNYRMTDIQAAIGIQQLLRIAKIVQTRRQLAAQYDRLLNNNMGIKAPVEPAWAQTNWQSYCVRLPPGIDQKSVMQSMLEQGVATRRGIMCAHLEPAFQDVPLRFPLPESERARDNCILLPLYPQMDEATQEKVAVSLHEAIGRQM